MKEEIIDLLSQLGYEYNEDRDGYLIDFLIIKVKEDILAAINTVEIPEEMHQDYIMGVCGELLQIMKTSGQLDLSALTFDGIETITEGDTTIGFSETNSNEATFSKLISYLTNWQSKVPHFRRLVW